MDSFWSGFESRATHLQKTADLKKTLKGWSNKSISAVRKAGKFVSEKSSDLGKAGKSVGNWVADNPKATMVGAGLFGTGYYFGRRNKKKR